MSSILIAEDDPAIREGLEAALQSDGHETRTAANGVEAMARIAERRPDLLLLDVMMPTKSGFTTRDAKGIAKLRAMLP
ncbi:MAG: response regulator [Kiritimatiellae bacterium]|nr:response regulator [Kiritimatiellia bacterium]